MQELFFTILTIWVLFKIFGGRSSFYFRTSSNNPTQQDSKTTIHNPPPVEHKQNKKSDTQLGEYVDYEEIK